MLARMLYTQYIDLQGYLQSRYYHDPTKRDK